MKTHKKAAGLEIRNKGIYKTTKKAMNKMTIASPYLSMIILNINSLTSPIKRQRMGNWVKKQDTIIYCL